MSARSRSRPTWTARRRPTESHPWPLHAVQVVHCALGVGAAIKMRRFASLSAFSQPSTRLRKEFSENADGIPRKGSLIVARLSKVRPGSLGYRNHGVSGKFKEIDSRRFAACPSNRRGTNQDIIPIPRAHDPTKAWHCHRMANVRTTPSSSCLKVPLGSTVLDGPHRPTAREAHLGQRAWTANSDATPERKVA